MSSMIERIAEAEQQALELKKQAAAQAREKAAEAAAEAARRTESAQEKARDRLAYAEETAKAASFFAPARFIPIHWGAYPLAVHTWNDSVKRSVSAAEKLGVKPLVPKIGEIFDSSAEPDRWYE